MSTIAIPTSFAQVGILTQSVARYIPLESFVWLEKTDGLRTAFAIQNGKLYKIIRGKLEDEENLKDVDIGLSVFDSEYYEQDSRDPSTGKYYIFDCLIADGSDIRDKYFEERMQFAKDVIEKLPKNIRSKFIVKEYYPVESWTQLLTFIDSPVSSISGNRIDGVICQRKDKIYDTNIKNINVYKLKRTVMTTVDFRLSWEESEKRFYLYLWGSFADVIYNRKRSPRNNKYSEKHTGINLRTRKLPKELYILFCSPLIENLQYLYLDPKWTKIGYFSDEIEQINTLITSMSKNPASYNNSILELSMTHDKKWVPFRFRKDKMRSNRYFIGLSNVEYIFAPIEDSAGYFEVTNKTTDIEIDEYHKINQNGRAYLLERARKQIDTSKLYLTAVDIAGGRGADLLSMYYLGVRNSLCIDADRSSITRYVNRQSNFMGNRFSTIKAPSFFETKALMGPKTTLTVNGIYGIMGSDNTNILRELTSRYEFTKADIVLMNYAIHYISDKSENIIALGKFIKEIISDTGIFVCTYFDGDGILKSIGKNVSVKLGKFTITLTRKIDEIQWANMPLPTIDVKGYREEPLVKQNILDFLGLTEIEHFYPFREEVVVNRLSKLSSFKLYKDYLQFVRVSVYRK